MARELLFGRHRLADGTSVTLRHPHRRDRDGVRALLRAAGIATGELELSRVLRFDPRERAVAVALEPAPGGERVVAVAAIDLRAGAEPDLLVADPGRGPALPTLLAGALVARAAAHARRVA